MSTSSWYAIGWEAQNSLQGTDAVRVNWPRAESDGRTWIINPSSLPLYGQAATVCSGNEPMNEGCRAHVGVIFFDVGPVCDSNAGAYFNCVVVAHKAKSLPHPSTSPFVQYLKDCLRPLFGPGRLSSRHEYLKPILDCFTVQILPHNSGDLSSAESSH